MQGWTVGNAAESEDRRHDDKRYEAVSCLACRRVHLVNPKTGKVMGADQAPS